MGARRYNVSVAKEDIDNLEWLIRYCKERKWSVSGYIMTLIARERERINRG